MDNLKKSIDKFVRDSYPNVHDVNFSTRKVLLGSSPGNPVVDVTVVTIVIDNSDNGMTTGQVYKQGISIINTVNGFFGLNYETYGSGWDFNIAHLHVSKVNM